MALRMASPGSVTVSLRRSTVCQAREPEAALLLLLPPRVFMVGEHEGKELCTKCFCPYDGAISTYPQRCDSWQYTGFHNSGGEVFLKINIFCREPVSAS